MTPLAGKSRDEINVGNRLTAEKRKEEKYIRRRAVLVNSPINRFSPHALAISSQIHILYADQIAVNLSANRLFRKGRKLR